MDLRGATATVGDGPALPVLDVQHEPGESVDTGSMFMMYGAHWRLKVDLTPELAGKTTITIPDWPPTWSAITVTAETGETVPGKGTLDMSETTITNGAPPTALVRFVPA